MKYLKIHLIKRKENDANARMLVPKNICATHWFARDDSCRALKAGYSAYSSALKEIFEDPDEKKVS